MIKLSIIIPTYNRAARLRRCLEALARQTQSFSDFDVIVVVDGSTDHTRAMLDALRLPFDLRVIWQPNSGVAAARNRGVAEARGRICLFLDDDIIADPELVAAHIRLHQDRADVVGFGQLTLALASDADWFARGFERSWKGHYERLSQSHAPLWKDCYSGNLSVPRAAMLAIGGFATDLRRSEDIELGYRLEQHGLRFVYVADAIGHQDERKGFHELSADAENAGAAAVTLYRRYPAMLPLLLGWFGDTSGRAVLLRRMLLALNVSPRWLNWIGRLLRDRPVIHEYYRLVHSYCYWRGVQRALGNRDAWRRLTYGTPILMYHAFGDKHEPPSRYIVPARRFVWQMRWLKWRGYRVLSLQEWVQYRLANELPPARSVVLTIDDGYADNHYLAYPILQHFHFRATIFLVSQRIGARNTWDSTGALANRALLDRFMLHGMASGGIRFGAHTRSHSTLPMLNYDQMRDEIIGSRTDLEREFGVPIDVFSYPYGKHDATVRALVHEAEFRAACGVRPALNWLNTPLDLLHRTEVFGTDSWLRFIRKVITGQSQSPQRRTTLQVRLRRLLGASR